MSCKGMSCLASTCRECFPVGKRALLKVVLKTNCSYYTSLLILSGKLVGPLSSCKAIRTTRPNKHNSITFDYSIGLISLPVISHVVVQRIVRIGSRQQTLNTQKDCSNLQSGRPLVLKNIQTNATQSIDVGVIYFSQEPHFRRSHGVIRR